MLFAIALTLSVIRRIYTINISPWSLEDCRGEANRDDMTEPDQNRTERHRIIFGTEPELCLFALPLVERLAQSAVIVAQ